MAEQSADAAAKAAGPLPLLPSNLVAPLAMPRLERYASHLDGSARPPSLVLANFPRTADQLTMLQRYKPMAAVLVTCLLAASHVHLSSSAGRARPLAASAAATPTFSLHFGPEEISMLTALTVTA